MTSEIVSINTKKLTAVRTPRGAQFPGPGDAEMVERAATEVISAYSALAEAKSCVEGAPAAIQQAERVLGTVDSRGLQAAVERASHDDLACHLAALVAAYPNGRVGRYFGDLLVADVGALEPSRGAIEAACHHLRRGSKFLPAISEICEAVASAEWTFEAASRKWHELPALIETVKQRQAERAEHERSQAELRAGRAALRLAATATTSTDKESRDGPNNAD
jgi:hypothetical protein